MSELDHHPENESRYSCEKCEDSGVTKDEREYCSCHLGAARKNSDRFAEMLRGVPHTEAIWTATHATMKAERATAAAEKAVLNMQLNGYAKDAYAKDLRIAELERELADVRAEVEARKLNPLNPFYDIEKDKEFREDFARLAEQGISKKQRGIILRGVMQAIHAYAADEARKAVAAMSTPNKGESK
jgi:hypothetical protein